MPTGVVKGCRNYGTKVKKKYGVTYYRHLSRLEELRRGDHGTGCQIPHLDPFNEKIMKFTMEIIDYGCKGLNWVECHGSKCSVTEKIMKTYSDVKCTYRDILYENERNRGLGQPTTLASNLFYNLEKSDHVKVHCEGYEENDVMFNKIIPIKWSGIVAGYRPIEVTQPATNNGISVLIVIFDTTSKNAFIRKMSRSYETLLEMGAVIFDGVNILGDATPAMLFPLLTGKMELEHPEARKGFTERFVDEKSLIFHWLKEKGYRTAYFEDMPQLDTFQCRFNGFAHQPADHYLYPLMTEWVNSYNFKFGCMGAMPLYKWIFGYSKQFFELSGPKFCVMHSVYLTHNHYDMISIADDDFSAYLKEFRRKGHLNDTLLIVMGDHGFRYGPIRETVQGKLEERLPLFSITLPEKLKRMKPNALDNLRANSKLLTTGFDIHSTLLDALGMEDLHNIKAPGSKFKRGMSLFEPIPSSRSCSDVGVLPHWCVCMQWTNVSQTDAMYNESAHALLDFLNDYTEEARSKCAIRTTQRIESVLRQAPIFHNDYTTETTFMPVHYYQVKIVTSPGDTVYEATLKFDSHFNNFTVEERDVSRVTKYGDQPRCVSKTRPHLRKYCYCLE